jgi:FolB domain-containing protein
MDSLVVKDLRLTTRIGVTAEERADPQTVLVSLEVRLDLSEASRSDDLGHTLDYGELVAQIAQLVEGAENRLLEKLAGDIAACVEGFSGVSGITVEVAKADPPLKEEVERVAVKIKRDTR